MVELLAPAGSYEGLCAAINAGADAVYIGGTMFGARAYAENPEEELLVQGIDYCHLHGRKLYMTVNTLLKEEELEYKLYDYLLPYYKAGLDGVIVQDFGVAHFLKEYFPGLDLHASTQMTVTGVNGAQLLKEAGFTRVVPARELSLDEIKRIVNETGLEVETFIHGAMCYSYSGQCLMSSMIGGRSGNRGRCAQPCRLPYRVIGNGDHTGLSAAEQSRNSRNLKNEEKREQPLYALSMKDMCTVDLLPELLAAGISSLKIEGRMKRPEYAAGVVHIYRKYIDLCQEQGGRNFRVSKEDREILLDLYNRGGFSQGYYHLHNGKSMMALSRPNHQGTQAAKIKNTNKNTLSAIASEALHKGDILELPDGRELTLAADAAEGILFQVKRTGASIKPGSILYRTKNEKLLQELSDAYIKRDNKEKIKGELRIFENSPAILKVEIGHFSVTVCAKIAEPATNQQTTPEQVRKQMMKTGNTPFVFDSLDIRMEEGLFVAVRALNELRREGLSQLQEQMTASARREAPDRGLQNVNFSEEKEISSRTITVSEETGFALNISIMSHAHLMAVLETAQKLTVHTLYLDTALFGNEAELHTAFAGLSEMIQSVKSAGIRCFLNCPPVFRHRERSFFEHPVMRRLMAMLDGFLVHTIDELSYFRAYIRDTHCEAVLVSDYNLYACNRRAEAFLHTYGVERTVMSPELNVRELKQSGSAGRELIVYGYQPLMQSAQCVQKNIFGCTKRPGLLFLEDRKKMRFPVQNRCAFCCNTIYNSVPLQLGGYRKEIEELSVAFVRLSFTIESADETKQILKQYHRLLFSDNVICDDMPGGTRGHFKRGVE